MAIDMRLTLMDTPKAHGGLALPILTQVAIVEQFGRVTNALGWCYGEAQSWMFEACNAIRSSATFCRSPAASSSLLCHHRGECRVRPGSHGDRPLSGKANTYVSMPRNGM